MPRSPPRSRHGANAVFLGANNMYWRPVSVGATRPYRELAIWKVPSLDPNAQNPALASLKWRDAPIDQPEQALLGEQFGCTDVLEPMTVPTTLGWVFAGSGATPGESLPGVIYQETDTPAAGRDAQRHSGRHVADIRMPAERCRGLREFDDTGARQRRRPGVGRRHTRLGVPAEPVLRDDCGLLVAGDCQS